MPEFYAKCGQRITKECNAATAIREVNEGERLCNGCSHKEEFNVMKEGVNVPIKGCLVSQIKPNKKTEHQTESGKNYSSITIYTFDPNLLFVIENIIRKMHGVERVQYKNPLHDCRKEICISFTPNSKGIAAKAIILESYLNGKSSLLAG